MIKIKIFLGVDHQGVKVKDEIIKYIKDSGFEIEAINLPNYETDDYPDFAYQVCTKVLESNGLGLLVCGSGIGMSIAANKIKGIKCARVVDGNDAFLAKNHNGANVIAFSSSLDKDTITDIIDNFIATKDANEERHLRRIEKIMQIENGTYHA